jgi:phosphoglycolate phosphatase-like HAD superfamily hydrolase
VTFDYDTVLFDVDGTLIDSHSAQRTPELGHRPRATDTLCHNHRTYLKISLFRWAASGSCGVKF